MYILVQNSIVQCISPVQFISDNGQVIWSDKTYIVGDKYQENQSDKLKIAFVTDWKIPCGISTYAEYLVAELEKLAEIKIFAEHHKNNLTSNDSPNTVRCWVRNESMDECVKLIKEYKPSIIITNFEWGLMPNGRGLLKYIQDISSIPNIFIMHSCFNHPDKLMICSAMQNIIVHSQGAQKVLANANIKSNVILHGRFPIKKIQKPWPILGNSKKILYYGFLFSYKSVETIIEAVEILKDKYPDILFLCLGSYSGYFNNIHSSYYYKLRGMIKDKNLRNNAIILTGYFPENILENYIAASDICVFSHKKTEGHEVFGGSGSISLPLSLETPTICSGQCSQFEEFTGILPKPANAQELAQEIDKILSDKEYANQLVKKANHFIADNTWEITAKRYIDLINKILEK